MAYSKNNIEKLAIETINKYNLIFFEELFPFLPISRATFYNWGMDKLDTIKEALNERKIKTKIGLRKKWYETGNATTEAMLYKLCGTEIERDILNNEKKQKDEDGDEKGVTINIIDLTKENVEKEKGNK